VVKVALYARVSTTDQTTDPQLLELRQAANARGWTIAGEFVDVISGTKKDRPALDQMMKLVKRGGIYAVVAVKLDRIGRSMAHFCRLTEILRQSNCGLICTSQGIDTTTGNACGELLQNLLMSIAQFERTLISERTKAGLAAARASGKSLGKPSKLLPPIEEQMKILTDWFRDHGTNDYRGLGKALGGVSGATALRIWRRHEKKILSAALDVS
jgi:DNA invertase Pin-like site-specific DNA recombinase